MEKLQTHELEPFFEWLAKKHYRLPMRDAADRLFEQVPEKRMEVIGLFRNAQRLQQPLAE